jgi:hypothetical protein
VIAGLSTARDRARAVHGLRVTEIATQWSYVSAWLSLQQALVNRIVHREVALLHCVRTI